MNVSRLMSDLLLCPSSKVCKVVACFTAFVRVKLLPGTPEEDVRTFSSCVIAGWMDDISGEDLEDSGDFSRGLRCLGSMKTPRLVSKRDDDIKIMHNRITLRPREKLLFPNVNDLL